MRQVQSTELPFGKPLPYDLFDGEGNLFRPAGHVLHPSELEAQWQRLRHGLLANPPVESMQLRVGQVLEENVHDANGRLLLKKGAKLSARQIELIRKISDRSPVTRDDGPTLRRPPGTPPERYATRSSRRLDEQVLSRGIDLSLPTAQTSFESQLPVEALLEARQRYERVWTASASRYAQFVEDMLAGRTLNPQHTDALLDEFIRAGWRDRSLPLLMLKRKLAAEDFLHTHALNVALLSMSVATHMGYRERAIRQLGVGALFQDIGMMRIPREVRLATRPLSHEEWAEVRCHPIYTVDTLERSGVTASTPLFIGYQAHERADASGYPRQRDARFIHPLSQLVGLADTYAAMIEPRPHRPALLPYEAITRILRDTKSQRFNPKIVRVFLDCLSLFPIGSLVELSDGAVASVVRSNPGKHTQPVVIAVDRNGEPMGREIDLARKDGVSVTRPLAEHQAER